MATLTANAAQSTVAPRFTGPGLHHATGVYSASLTLATADVIQMVRIPDGAVIHDVAVSQIVALAAGTGAPILAVGDGDVDDRYISASIGSAATIVRMGDRDAGNGADHGLALGYEYSAEDTIDITVRSPSHIAGGGTLSAVLGISVIYSLNGPNGLTGG